MVRTHCPAVATAFPQLRRRPAWRTSRPLVRGRSRTAASNPHPKGADTDDRQVIALDVPDSPATRLLGEVITWTCPGLSVAHSDPGRGPLAERPRPGRRPRTGPPARLRPRLPEALRPTDHPARGRGRDDPHLPVHRREPGRRPLRVRAGDAAHPGQADRDGDLRPARPGDPGPGGTRPLHRRPDRRRRHPGRPAALRAAGRPVPHPAAGRRVLRPDRARRLRRRVQGFLGRVNGRLLRFPVPAGNPRATGACVRPWRTAWPG